MEPSCERENYLLQTVFGVLSFFVKRVFSWDVDRLTREEGERKKKESLFFFCPKIRKKRDFKHFQADLRERHT